MNSNAIVHIGVDVSKQHLDLSKFDGGKARITNNPKGIASLIKRVKAIDSEVIVTCEATGGYERLLLSSLCKAGVESSLVNAGHVRYFARSQGASAKTDSIDARMIAEFAEVRHNSGRLFLTQASHMELQELQDLMSYRETLINERLAHQNRLDPQPSSAYVVKHLKSQIRDLEARQKKLEAEIDRWVKEHEEFQNLYTRLIQIKGLGRISVLTLIAFIPELGKESNRRIGSLVGVVPYNCDSGNTEGHRSISGGRRHVRNIIYMAAMTAGQHNPILKVFRNRLIANGKPHKVARIAIARKLIALANRVAADPEFQPVDHLSTSTSTRNEEPNLEQLPCMT